MDKKNRINMPECIGFPMTKKRLYLIKQIVLEIFKEKIYGW